MYSDAVYQKTQKGLDEVASRQYHLPARERSVLILVDGKSSAVDVIGKARHFGDAEHFFDALVDDGFIAPIASRLEPEPAVVAAAPAAAQMPAARQDSAAAPPAARSLAEARAFAGKFLIGLIGPQADTMTGAIDRCKNATELLQVMTRYAEMVKDVGGARKLEAFVSGIQSRLPA